MTSKNIMIVGVDDQGTLLASRMLGKLAIDTGYDVELSEVHGMAQRGGSVVTFVKYGERVAKPIVEEDQADVLITFERLETLRHLHFLEKDDMIIINDWCIDPITMVAGVAEYPKGVIDRLKEARRIIMMETTGEAKKMDAPRTLNVIVLGAAAKHTGFEREGWPKVIEITIPPKMVEVNGKTFETGYALSV